MNIPMLFFVHREMTPHSPCLLQLASSCRTFTPCLWIFCLCIHGDAHLLHTVTSTHRMQASAGYCHFFPQHNTGWWWAGQEKGQLRLGRLPWGLGPTSEGCGQCWKPGMSPLCPLWPSGLQEWKHTCQGWSLGIWVCVGSLQRGDTIGSVGSGLTRACSMRRQNRMALPTSLRLWNTSVLSSAYSMMSFSWWWKNSRIPESHNGEVRGHGHCLIRFMGGANWATALDLATFHMPA